MLTARFLSIAVSFSLITTPTYFSPGAFGSVYSSWRLSYFPRARYDKLLPVKTNLERYYVHKDFVKAGFLGKEFLTLKADKKVIEVVLVIWFGCCTE